MASPRFALSIFIAFALVSCRPTVRRDPAIGEAFVGPANVPLHKEISPKSPIVATLHFGDKLEILGNKRKFVRVRTKAGAEGWLDDRSLLGQAEMDQIAAQSAIAAKYPSQGVATTFDTMNVHAQPSRYSPSYIQIKEGEKFDVLEHRLVVVQSAAPRKNLIPVAKPRAKRPKKQSKSKVPPPPAPAAPPLPLDWQELSKAGQDAIPPKEEDAPPAPPEEDWSLVRTASGQSGWVLTRRLYMAIPDEVAQYAEGKRITSYFSLGKIHDEDRVKDFWLWTTSDGGNRPYDFDGYRVFIWSLRRHRYETALIQRRIRGYFPTHVDSAAGTFALCVEKEDGQRYRRQYRMVDAQVKFAGEKPCEVAPNKSVPGKDSQAAQNQQSPEAPKEGTLDKLKGKIKSIIKKE
jgi:hypothetical protein